MNTALSSDVPPGMVQPKAWAGAQVFSRKCDPRTLRKARQTAHSTEYSKAFGRAAGNRQGMYAPPAANREFEHRRKPAGHLTVAGADTANGGLRRKIQIALAWSKRNFILKKA